MNSKILNWKNKLDFQKFKETICQRKNLREASKLSSSSKENDRKNRFI